MQSDLRWRSSDLEMFPKNGKRYEIIDGELFVSKQPHYHHQYTCLQIGTFLQIWSRETKLGQANMAPGLIFADDDDVAPDMIWISYERRALALQPDGKLHLAPELAIEVLSQGFSNEQRDKDSKLKLYSRRGVQEYWIVDWFGREVSVYRRKAKQLRLTETLYQNDYLQSPLLPGFKCLVGDLFDQIPTELPPKAGTKASTKSGAKR